MHDLSALKSQPPGYSFVTESYDIFQMIFVASGTLEFTSRDGKSAVATVLEPGNFLVLRKRSRFSLASPRDGYAGLCYLDYAAGASDQSGHSFCLGGDRWLLELTGLLQFALSFSQPFTPRALAMLGRTVALHCVDEEARGGRSAPDATSARLVEQLRRRIQSSVYDEAASLEDHVGDLGLSYRQLTRLFRRHTGRSMKRFQIEERLREAKRLLGSTDMTVTQIAFELHYASSQKFAAQFRAITGVSPTEYRREYG